MERKAKHEAKVANQFEAVMKRIEEDKLAREKRA